MNEMHTNFFPSGGFSRFQAHNLVKILTFLRNIRGDRALPSVMSCASRGLSRAERNYQTHKLEFLALKWAIPNKFQDGTLFTVLTDTN